MFRLDRLGLLVLICLVSGITLSLFFEAVGVQAKQSVTPNSLLLTPTAEPSSPGQPCGSGQQLPPNIICLYGTVSQQSASGVITPLNGVLVTITLGSQSVTDTTFVHPGNNTPTYGIDIHFLNPQFLQPVTLTAVVDNMLISRQVIVFPDFQTMSQRYDLVVPPVASLPQGLWGYVVDFASGGPVAGAVITAEHGGQFITATTIVPDPGNDPYYQLDPSTIASPGEQIIITATFNLTVRSDLG
jgi:hypothetical protein